MSGTSLLAGGVLECQFNSANFSKTGAITWGANPNGSLGGFVQGSTQAEQVLTIVPTGARTDVGGSVITVYSVGARMFFTFFPKALTAASNALASSAITFPAAVPVQFRPGNAYRFDVGGTANSVEQTLKFLIGTNGDISIQPLGATTFTSGQSCNVTG